MKTLFVHDWLNGMRGGEKCLEALLELFPGAPIYTLLYEPAKISEQIRSHPVHTSWVQRAPFGRAKYRYYLPLFPWAVNSLKLEPADLVISISHCAAKSVKIPSSCRHISYCLTPMRYLWGFYDEYFGRGPYHWTRRIGLDRLLGRLRRWDLESSKTVDAFVAISRHVAERIRRVYGRESVVVYPPVDVGTFHYKEDDPREDFYLIVSALVPYKRIDLAIETFNHLGIPLKIIGAGTEMKRLRGMSRRNIEFLGWQPGEILRSYYARARALIFPGEEDFGITPVEAQACGTPVAAFARGGVLETVLEGKTGTFFERQDRESLSLALERLKAIPYDRRVLRDNALRFRKEVFIENFRHLLRSQGL